MSARNVLTRVYDVAKPSTSMVRKELFVSFMDVNGTESVFLRAKLYERIACEICYWYSHRGCLVLVDSMQTIGRSNARKIAWTKSKSLLTNKYCPRTEVKKMEDEFYNLVVKENDLKNYARRFQELAVLCPNMVRNTKKLMKAFIGGLPRSLEGNVTASKPQTEEEPFYIPEVNGSGNKARC
ncbi:reverse transcriptase domain-containing protein [Tanacetum coccineum]|uniref:Reverse transcriptase domain-containing protein n=1 Tax=Tanacetum coccineum TaxID=301880 RepID=A0ABQ4ZD24_9ASTR